MNLPELKEELISGKVRNCYVFMGDELALQDIYVDKIQELCGLQKLRIESIRGIYNTLGVKTLIKVPPKMYVMRNDEDYKKTEKMWADIISGKKQGKNILVFLYTDLDKRGKFCKEHEKVLTEFGSIDPNILAARLEATTKLPLKYCQDLVKLCNGNYGRLKHELQKLYELAKIDKCNLEMAYLEAKKYDMIHEDIGDIIFDFSNAVIERNKPLSYKLCNQLKQTDEGPIKLISVLYNSFRNVLMVQSTNINERTEEVLGLTKAQIYITSRKCNRYTLFELVDAMKVLQYVEKGIKTGQVDINFSMDYLLAKIL